MLHGLPRSASAALALALCACGPARAPAPQAAPPPASPQVAEEAPPVPAAAPPEEPAAPLPPWIGRIESPACSWWTERWSPSGIAEIRTRPGGPVFARVNGGRARLHAPVGAADHGLADVASGGLAIHGYVSREHVQMYAAAAFAMNGVLYPYSSSVLSWKEGFEDGISVTMAAPEGVIVKNPPLTARRPCTDLSLDRGAYFLPAKSAFGREYGDHHLIRAGRTLDVFADPSRPADVRLVLREDVYAMVFATSGAFSRIGADVNGMYVAGWVRSNNLGDAWGGGHGRFGGFGRSGLSPRRAIPLRTVVCAADVPLVAEAGDERVTAGHVLAGTRIDVISEGDTLSPIQIDNRDIHPGASATFLARASDLRACATVQR